MFKKISPIPELHTAIAYNGAVDELSNAGFEELPPGRQPFFLHLYSHPFASPGDVPGMRQYMQDPGKVAGRAPGAEPFYASLRRARDLGGKVVRLRLLADEALVAEAQLRDMPCNYEAGEEIWVGLRSTYLRLLEEGGCSFILNNTVHGFYAFGMTEKPDGWPGFRRAVWHEYPDDQYLGTASTDPMQLSPLQRARLEFWTTEYMLASQSQGSTEDEQSPARLVPYQAGGRLAVGAEGRVTEAIYA